MISTFGTGAYEFASGLAAADIDAVITEVAALPAAIIEAVRRREQGQLFYGMLLFEDPRSRAIFVTASAVLSQIPDPDTKRLALTRLAAGTLDIGEGKTSSAFWPPLDVQVASHIKEFFLLADAMLVRSFTEYARLAPLCKRKPRVETIVADTVVPNVLRSIPHRPSVVVWAPGRKSQEIAYHAFALVEFRGNVTCVTADGASLPDSAARFAGAQDPNVREALATATCIVCVEPEDPGAAVAFARLGYGIVAPLTSGSHEFVRDAVTYDYREPHELHEAVAIAIAQPASLRELPKPPRGPYRPALPPPEELPLVSVVTPTFSRPHDLRRMLGGIARQTYPRIEAVVINDGGENVDDVVARFPFARVINLDHVGVAIAANTGIKAARGAYIVLNADDDWLQPDHIESLVGAMLRTGAAVAHGNGLIRNQEREPDGSFATIGFNAAIFNETTSPTRALVSTPIAGNSMIFRTDILDEIGHIREDCMLADQEFQLRAAERYAFLWVDRMTSEFRSRGKHQFSNSADSLPEMRRVYEELHPVSGRPQVQAWRDETLQRIASRPGNLSHTFPPTVLLPVPEQEPPFEDVLNPRGSGAED